MSPEERARFHKGIKNSQGISAHFNLYFSFLDTAHKLELSALFGHSSMYLDELNSALNAHI